jgi:hypothetical protein
MFLFVPSLLLGCTGSGGAEYTLQLTPLVASPQTPFEDLERIDLVLTPADGEPLRVPLDGATSGTTPEVTGLPPLVNTRITVEGYRDGEIVMRGRTEPLTASSGVVEATVFIASTEATAWLGALDVGLYHPMLAPLGEGRFWLGGGATNNRSNEPGKGQDLAYTLSLAPPGADLSFVAATSLPAYLDSDAVPTTERTGATCTRLTVTGEDAGKLLITGGAASDPLQFDGQASSASSLYDPATDTWEDLAAMQGMQEPRVGHIALENVLGNVVIWGGLGATNRENQTNLPNTVEVYERATGKFTGGEVLADIGQLDALIADLGTEGTLICGGAAIDGSAWSSSDACSRVTLDGSAADAFESLPRGLAGAASATLPDGRVLVTGGATATDALVDESIDAVASAWLYNPTTEQWGSLAQTMNIPRVGHRMVALADGRVLIIGGAQTYNVTMPAEDPVSCLEIYDPTDGTFTSVDGCEATDDSGGLLAPTQLVQAAYDPDYGVLIVGGIGADGSAQDGVSLFVPSP